MHMLGVMVVQILILQDCGIDNTGNYLKFLNKILLWSWYIDLVTQPFSVCFYMGQLLFHFYLEKLSLRVYFNFILLMVHVITQQ